MLRRRQQQQQQPAQTRSGGRYGLLRDQKDDDDDAALARGTSRTGAPFRRVGRGHYASLAALRKAHVRLFTQDAVFVFTGESERNARSFGLATHADDGRASLSELPVAGAYTGIGQGVLRVRADASDAYKSGALRKAYRLMYSHYPNQTLYVTLTANVILRSTKHTSFSVFFGQSFGNTKAVYYGQEHHPVSGDITRLFSEFAVDSIEDLKALPINFTRDDFDGIYKRNFANSAVAVHRVVSLVYFLSVGLDNYERDHTQTTRTPVRLF